MVQVNESLPVQKPRPLRLAFRKVGVLQYISHLDLQRTMTRALIRARIPVWYTEGFNPKPRIAFSAPLSVGSESLYELMDFRVVTPAWEDESAELASYLEALKEQLPQELMPFSVYASERKFSEIAYADYDISFAAIDTVKDANEIGMLLTRTPLRIIKRTGKGEKETDISPMIKRLAVAKEGGVIHIRAILSASSAAFLNPEYVIRVLKETSAFGFEQELPEYSIVRTDLLSADMEHFT